MFAITRQHYWGSGESVVEVVNGGLDYAGSDMLSEYYRKEGDGREYEDPRDAVKAAIQVRDAWQKDSPDTVIGLTCVGMGGMGFEGETMTTEEATAWADGYWEKMPKCAHCNHLLGRETYSHDLSEDKFCSEVCADQDYGHIQEEDSCSPCRFPNRSGTTICEFEEEREQECSTCELIEEEDSDVQAA